MEPVRPKPVIKWVGGKRQLIPELTKSLPPFHTYYEVFAGGAALFFELRALGFTGPVYLNDLNDDLVNLYANLRDRLPEVVRAHERLVEEFFIYPSLEEKGLFFYENREAWNILRNEEQSTTRTARLLFLNKACHGGLFRVNKDGFFNVPFGKYEAPSFTPTETLQAASQALKGSAITWFSFDNLPYTPQPGSLVYFDPPYITGEESDFTSYTAEGFGTKEQERLARRAYDLACSGVNVMLSNSDDPLIERLYPGWNIERVQVRRSINRDVQGRDKGAGEVIIRSWRT